MRLIGAAVAACALTLLAVSDSGTAQAARPLDGKPIFRYDTFGDEQFWTDVLRMNEVLENVPPEAALTLGLKVDADALPPPVVQMIEDGELDVTDPKVTRRLLEMNAIVGVVGRISGDRIRSVGITCALCHSTVDDSLGPGIGHRLDGWPNLDLDVGKIVGLSPAEEIAPFIAEFAQWGPGKYDARHHAFNGSALTLLIDPPSQSIPVVIPPAYGLQGVGFETYTGDGPISYWNAYVAITQMGGQGDFDDPRIPLTVNQSPDRVTSKLAALLAYQLSLTTPPAPAGDAAARARGQQIFDDAALLGEDGRCARCHVPPTYTDVLTGPNPQIPLLHSADDIGGDDEYASRSATGMYRTTPLRALWQHAPYFHDGRAEHLYEVIAHYETFFGFALTQSQRDDLVEFLKSL